MWSILNIIVAGPLLVQSDARCCFQYASLWQCHEEHQLEHKLHFSRICSLTETSHQSYMYRDTLAYNIQQLTYCVHSFLHHIATTCTGCNIAVTTVTKDA